MPSLVFDLLPVLLKRRSYDDLSDYNKGWIDGIGYLAVFGGTIAIYFGGPKWSRWVDETPS